MKRYKQLHEILATIHRVHCEAAERCAESACVADERLDLLAGIFRKREESLGRRLESFDDAERKRMTDIWVRNNATQRVEDALAALHLAQDQAECLRICLELQTEIVALFRQLAESLNAPIARSLLQDLAKCEETALKHLGLAQVTQLDA